VRLLGPELTPSGTDSRLFQDSLYADMSGLRPNAEGLSNGARFRVDADGFWAYATPADTSRPAWLFLGDSVTMGIGVAPDSTFAGRLAPRLDSLTLLNPSLPGYSTRNYRAVLETLTAPDATPFRIHRATVFWCLNDVYVPAENAPGAGVRQLGGRLLTFLRLHVRTYGWLKALFFDRPRTYFEHDRTLYEGPAFEAALANLKAMKTLADDRRIVLDVVILPYAYQLRRPDDPGIFAPQQRLTAALTEAGLPARDAAPYLLQHMPDSEALYLYGDGIHFSRGGHALLAEYLRP